MKLIPFCWYSNEGLLVFDEDQESIRVVQSDNNLISTSIFQALEKICGQEINNKVAMESDSKKVSYGRLEDLLQKFINDQISKHNTTSEQSQQGSGQEIKGINISNSFQHKGRERLANKRYLSTIENHDTKRI
ncbi:20304_t:CDS:2 [Gigaspora margarita]|uniref:20304_t:CDS:1 n=1 Tax=Gigaspora margarita TaxID=4874 RepID=A0ABN7WPL8_GIGMA|nr:20304_t:CDS:2 [Gigaspora margarita]